MIKTSNQITLTSFIIDLIKYLDRVRPDSRTNHIILLDNCAALKTLLAMDIFNKLEVPNFLALLQATLAFLRKNV